MRTYTKYPRSVDSLPRCAHTADRELESAPMIERYRRPISAVPRTAKDWR
jgi:hypothetical protein